MKILKVRNEDVNIISKTLKFKSDLALLAEILLLFYFTACNSQNGKRLRPFHENANQKNSRNEIVFNR